ncbi:MAG: sigma-70 family RNA polymerase sigma factor [Lentisphaeraceae bacterium]|nr:sigma-70 family RNA polymerase sigma factor [Lentisphaeraceae bacterium]
MSQEISDELSVLLSESQPRIYGFIFKRVADHDQAKDILQETNLVICRKASDYEEGSNFIAWAFRIAHFQILSYRQKANSGIQFSDQTIELLSVENEKSSEVFTNRISALKGCLQTLSDDNQQLIMKRYTGRFSVQDYAREMGKRENAVSKALHKIRASLSRCIRVKMADMA